MLSDRDRAILAFEVAHPEHNGAKEELIRTTFAMRAIWYYAVVRTILANPASEAEFPLEVHTLQRLRASQVRARQSRRFAA